MKVAALVLALVSAALAMPRARFPGIQRQQSLRSITNQYCFILTLPEFTARRNRREPPNLDWSSDGCTAAPNNPFGFPFLPGCHRHDFGYRNFRRQNRFNRSNKKAIDEQLKSDLYSQCEQIKAWEACEKLADVYFLAVRAFGSLAHVDRDVKRDTQLDQAYADAVKAYDEAVAKAQEAGLLPVLT